MTPYFLSSPATGSRECAPDDRLQRAIQYAEALVIESKRCGVLDTPLEPVIGLAGGETRWRSMTASCGAWLFENRIGRMRARQDAVIPAENPQVAAGFFFDFAGLGCTTAPGARSIDVSRPAVKV
jgi:hypothetical protein